MKIVGRLLAAIMALIGISWWITQPDSAETSTTGQTPTPTPAIARAHPPTPTTPRQQPSPAPSTPQLSSPTNPDLGQDTDDSPPAAPDPSVDPAAVTRTTRAFVDGWLTHNPTKRVRLLTPVTDEQLLDGLAITDPENIPKAKQAGPPTIIRAAGGTVETRQTFTSHPPIALLLTIDASSRHGWVVSSVRPAP